MSLDYDSWLSCQVDKEMEEARDYEENTHFCGVPFEIVTRDGNFAGIRSDDEDLILDIVDSCEPFAEQFVSEYQKEIDSTAQSFDDVRWFDL